MFCEVIFSTFKSSKIVNLKLVNLKYFFVTFNTTVFHVSMIHAHTSKIFNSYTFVISSVILFQT